MERKLTGLFLGAGASYNVSMPLVWELTTELKNWLTVEKLKRFNAGWKEEGGGHPDEVIEDFISVLARDDLHYESILGYLEVQSRRQRSLSSDYHSLYAWLVQMIYYTLYFKHVKGADFIVRNLELYRGVVHLYEENTPLWVFSLNHDSIIEMIAKKFSIPLFSGLNSSDMKLPRRNGEGEIIGYIKVETIDQQTLDHGAMNFPNPGEKGIYLLKLHGALDLFAFNDGNDLLKLVPDEETPEAVISVLKAANEELVYLAPGAPGGIARALNEIAYADSDGEMQFLRRSLLSGARKFHEHGSQVLPKSMLNHFRSNINFLTSLVCVGYGFGDHHVNEVIKGWLEFSSKRSIDIVSPGIAQVPSFLLHVAPQVRIIDSGAVEYFDSIAGIERTPLELMSKEIAAASRKVGPQRSAQILEDFRLAEERRTDEAVARALEIYHSMENCNEQDVEKLVERLRSEIGLSDKDYFSRLLALLKADKCS
ncbi:hypothetical protein DLD99_21475 [Pseudomonas kribbensis]|uniref:SIR2-like domain-containing protein n=1 Tax=Pseudomonas kribbensis TaxID=1628086 RepID=A0A345RUH2_9PSED|nr:hypothetical protein [Pseudomonas kribbensis]AXI62938.1 hypothetical protein DLD99_21475 [Pseudomonas kribbensis]